LISIDEGDICALCLYDDIAPDAEPCVRCNEQNLEFKWKPFPILWEVETEEV